ncbi:flagellar basal body-associated FliL family protein [Aliiroseovarius sp. 2305UL8-7]|uniref:flagellar basal body-associated FliL family protein n=1 Tax=Aliiroseovarius conchicola TaxID=3121637 RepID=UPI003529A41A
MKKLFPILLALVGLGAGAGAGMFLRPEPEMVEINPCGEVDDEVVIAVAEMEDDEVHSDSEFVKINNQFVIPVVNNDKVTSLVVMSLSLEVSPGNLEAVYLREPKLRDEFLQVMFNHANNGGFDGVFTQTSRLTNLRRALTEVATSILGNVVYDVLVTNIVRQDQ